MLIRFITDRFDRRSGRRQGLFAAAIILRDSGNLAEVDDDALKSLWDWFNENLQKPARLSLSSRPNAKAQALSWFKDTAITHIAKMRDFAEILERYDVRVQLINTDRPGYVVYEDEHQLCAYPFADTQT